MILGTGWGAYRLVKSIDTRAYQTIIVSPRNHFLFTPLLASTTVGTLEFRSIVEPIRKARHDVDYYQAECTDIDTSNKVIQVSTTHQQSFQLPYDKLVIAVGAKNSTFNIPGVAEHAYFLKELHHARAIRNRIIECFEEASLPSTPDSTRKQLLNFVVVGGGPTGIEFAAELNDFFWEDLSKSFPKLPVNEVRITVLEASKTILSAFDSRLAEYTIKSFRKQGIDLRTNSLVKEVRDGEVVLQDGTVIRFGLLVWSTGIAPRTFVHNVKNLPQDHVGRIIVGDDLKVKGLNEVYALGDCSTIEGHPLQATAQVAQQQGKYLAASLNDLSQGESPGPFVFHFMGMMAYIGHYKSLFDTPTIKSSGFAAWVSWRSVYLTRLGSVKSKFQVPFDWFRSFVFGRDITAF